MIYHFNRASKSSNFVHSATARCPCLSKPSCGSGDKAGVFDGERYVGFSCSCDCFGCIGNVPAFVSRAIVSVVFVSSLKSFPLTIPIYSKDAEVFPPPAESGVAPVDARWANAAVIAFASVDETGQRDCELLMLFYRVQKKQWFMRTSIFLVFAATTSNLLRQAADLAQLCCFFTFHSIPQPFCSLPSPTRHPSSLLLPIFC